MTLPAALARIAELEAENACLKARIAALERCELSRLGEPVWKLPVP